MRGDSSRKVGNRFGVSGCSSVRIRFDNYSNYACVWIRTIWPRVSTASIYLNCPVINRRSTFLSRIQRSTWLSNSSKSLEKSKINVPHMSRDLYLKRRFPLSENSLIQIRYGPSYVLILLPFVTAKLSRTSEKGNRYSCRNLANEAVRVCRPRFAAFRCPTCATIIAIRKYAVQPV